MRCFGALLNNVSVSVVPCVQDSALDAFEQLSEREKAVEYLQEVSDETTDTRRQLAWRKCALIHLSVSTVIPTVAFWIFRHRNRI